MAAPGERGAVIAIYYAVAYLGFAVPYLAAGLSVLAGRPAPSSRSPRSSGR
jgi:hypothetical protein